MFFHNSRRGCRDIGHRSRFARAGLYLGQAKVENLGVPALGDEEVRGLDVAVDDAFAVRRVQRVGNLNAQRQDRLQLHGAPGDHVLERRAVQELHH